MVSVILAAGESKRMGVAKLMLEYHHTTLLSHAIQKAKRLSETVYVVVGKYAELYRQEAQKSKVTIIENRDWSEGLASSLRIAIKSLPQDTKLALILLPDQPFVPLEHLQALIDEQAKTGAQLVFSSYQNTLGAPTLIHHSLFDQVQMLRGNVGAKALLKEGVIVSQVGLESSVDIDTPEDAKNLSEKEKVARDE